LTTAHYLQPHQKEKEEKSFLKFKNLKIQNQKAVL